MVSNITYRQGIDFFESTCQVIAFVCNCTSDRSIGFARQVVEHFPYVDVLKNRIQKPGTLELWGKNKRDQRYILGLFAQYSRDDNIHQRLEWFKTCLKKITKQLPMLKSIAFPRRNKNPECKCSYLQAIEDWAKIVPRISVEIIEVKSPHERYLDTTTPSEPTEPPEPSEPSEPPETDETDESGESKTQEEFQPQIIYKIIVYYSVKYHAIFGDKNLI